MRKKQLQIDKIQLVFIGVLMTIICPGKGCDNNQTDVLSGFQDAESTNIIESTVKMQTTPDYKNIIMTTDIFKGHIFDDYDNNIAVRKKESNKAKRELFKKKEGKIAKVRNKRRKEKEHRRKNYYNEVYDDEMIDSADQNDFMVKSKYEKRSSQNKYHLIRNNKNRDDVSTESKADILLEILKNYNRRSAPNLTLNKYDQEIDSYKESTEFSPDSESDTLDYRKIIKMIKKNARTSRNPGYDSMDLKDNYDMLTIHNFFLTSQKFKFLPKKEISSSKTFLSNKNLFYFKPNPSKSSSTFILPTNKDILKGPNVKLLRKSKALTSEPPVEQVKTKKAKADRKGKLKQVSFLTHPPNDFDFHEESRGRIAPILNKRSIEPSPEFRAAEEQHDKVMDILKMLGIVILVFAGLLLMICGALLCCRRKKMCLVYILKAFKSPRYREFNRPCPCPPPKPAPCPPPCPPPCPTPCIPICAPTDCCCKPVKLCKKTVCCNFCQSPECTYPGTAPSPRRNTGFGFRSFPARESYRK